MKIRRADLSDLEFVLKVIDHPDVYNISSDDGIYQITQDNVELFLQNDLVHIIIPTLDEEDMGFFLFIQVNIVTVELHTCILPEYRGIKVVEAAQLVKDYIFNQAGYRKIVTQVPWYNKSAIFMALRCGFKKEGINKQSFLKDGILFDQYYMGLCKE